MKCWCLCCQPQRSRPAPTAWPQPYLSQMLRSKGLCRVLSFPRCFSSGTVTISHLSQTSDFLVGRSLLYSSACHPTPHLFPLSVSLWDPSIHLSPSLPSVFPLLPCLAHCPFPLRSRERVPCVYCLAACPLSSFSPYPLRFFIPPYPHLSCLSLIPCFLSFPYLCLYFSSLPPSPHLSPSTSLCPHHSFHLLLITSPQSLSLAAFIHTLLSVFLSPILPPSLPPPSSFPRLGSGAVNRCCLLLIWVRLD